MECERAVPDVARVLWEVPQGYWPRLTPTMNTVHARGSGGPKGKATTFGDLLRELSTATVALPSIVNELRNRVAAVEKTRAADRQWAELQDFLRSQAEIVPRGTGPGRPPLSTLYYAASETERVERLRCRVEKHRAGNARGQRLRDVSYARMARTLESHGWILPWKRDKGRHLKDFLEHHRRVASPRQFARFFPPASSSSPLR